MWEVSWGGSCTSLTQVPLETFPSDVAGSGKCRQIENGSNLLGIQESLTPFSQRLSAQKSGERRGFEAEV